MRALRRLLAGTAIVAAPATAQPAPVAGPAALVATPAIATIRDCPDCPALAVIPAQSVRIGTHEDTPDRRVTERRPVTATIAAPFAMATTEVTRAQYAVFMAESRYKPPVGVAPGCNYFNGIYGYVAGHDWQNPGFAQRETEPVLCVSSADATAYAAWLTKRTGRAYRVPSSVEFEVATRAGATTAFPWGNATDKACEFANIADKSWLAANPGRASLVCDDQLVFTAPVARYKPNAYGLHDMIGNAWEWTTDCWREDLAGAPVDGRPVTAAEGGDCDFRTPMGGGWISGLVWARTGTRSKDPAGYRSFMLGFRVAADLKPGETAPAIAEITPRAIIEAAYAVAGGDAYKTPGTYHLSGSTFDFKAGPEPVEFAPYDLYRVQPRQHPRGRVIDGRNRISAMRTGKPALQVAYDGADAAFWRTTRGFGMIRDALSPGYTLARLADDMVDGALIFSIRITDAAGESAVFSIRSAESRVVKVAFPTPRGLHERVFSHFYTRPGVNPVQPRRLRSLIDGVKEAEFVYSDFTIGAPLPDDLLVIAAGQFPKDAR